MIKNIFAYDESNYRGKYEYRYDPEHKNKPKGERWYMTSHGWARGISFNRRIAAMELIKIAKALRSN